MSRHHRRNISKSPERAQATPKATPAHLQKIQTVSPSIFQQIITWLFHLLVITTPLFFAFNTDELFEFNKMILVYVYTVLIVAVWLARMVFEKRFIWHSSKLDYLIGLFLFSQLLSTLFSIHPYTSWLGYYSRFHGGLASLICYALLYWAFVANVGRRTLRPLALSTMMTAALVSLYAIGEHFGHSFSCYLTSSGTSFGVDCWVQDVQHRVFATFGQPNWLAAYALMLLSALIGMLLGRWPKGWERAIYYFVYLLLLLTLLYTRSRSGFLGFLAAVLVIGAGLTFKWWLERSLVKNRSSVGILNQKQTSWWQTDIGTIVFLVGLTVGGIALSGSPYSPSITEFVAQQSARNDATAGATVFTPDELVTEPVVNRLDIGGTDSGEIRKIVWQGALDVWKRYPLLGSGVETFAYSYYQDRPLAHNLVSEWDFLYNKAHNEFLNFLATTGALGLGSYLLLLVGYGLITLFGFRTLVRSQQTDQAVIVLALAGAVVGLSVSNFFGFSTVVVTVFQYLAFAITVMLIVPSPSPARIVKEISIWQLAVWGVIVVAALFPLKGIFDYYRADKLYTAAKGLSSRGQMQAAGEKLATAIKLSPLEALYWDELGQLYAQAAVSFALTDGASESIDQLSSQAVAATDQAMLLNNRQLNLYKTRARIFIILSQIDPSYVDEAVKTLEAATILSPTDPKLLYNLALLKLQQNDAVSALQLLRKAVEFKPNYGSALSQLSSLEWERGDKLQAVKVQEQLVALEPNAQEERERLASYSAYLARNPDGKGK